MKNNIGSREQQDCTTQRAEPASIRPYCGGISSDMPRYPQADQDVIDQARISRDRAKSTAKKSSSLIERAARLEETVRKTEEQLRELKATVGDTTNAAFNSRKRGDKRVKPQ